MSDPERLAFERWLNNGHHCGANENMWKAWLARSLLDAPTHGADGESLRPVAIYQEWIGSAWVDVEQEQYEGARVDRRRIVYTARDDTPSKTSAASIFAPEVPWWKVMELAEKHGKGWSQYSGWTFLNDDALHEFACAIASSAVTEKTK